ncbi:hypothetical protein TRICI_006066 [Trichomonascus ciferrii]|uniref:SWIRM domain-containing protein n=1 Tax=Trichomonascus ciferrii TaxID=44093 RepID=A0A642UM41_9ASCO|nr:hypothetical protein TRICI_006066 [Trichomonascus ciferrii]
MSSKLLQSVVHNSAATASEALMEGGSRGSSNRSPASTGGVVASSSASTTSNAGPGVDDDKRGPILSPPLSPYPKAIALADADDVLSQQPTGREGKGSGAGTLRKAAGACDGGAHYKICKLDPNTPMISSAWSLLKHDPVAYFKRERGYLDMYPRNGPTWSNYVHLSHPEAQQPGLLLPSTQKSKLRRRKRRLNNNNNNNNYATSDVDSSDNGMVTRSQRTSSRAVHTPTRSRNTTPKPRSSHHHRSANSPAAPASKVHDLEYEDVTDYCPSLDTLPPGKPLKADWKGAPMDLSGDPDAKFLHPAELHLASVLRLSARLYLDSKRRLFAEKVHRMRHGLPFRRTDSQKACRIDVNKASRLFSAFERVGWLDDKLFTKYLN